MNLSTDTSSVPITDALGQSDAFLRFQEQISRVAPVNRPVLILGERGSGKELAASRIHFLSKRWEKPFVTLNCAALTPTLIESELFGYEKGAFTGAVSRKTGRFEAASGGTLFLDEIGTIPIVVQEKILRAVEYGSFERVGSSMPIHVDVRIVAATNADLSAMARAGTFKQDLLDRLSFEVIYVPPLRYRKEDISLLAAHFAARMAFEMGSAIIPEISSSALDELERYPWPGNIRELKNVIERAVYTSGLGPVESIRFDPFVNPYDPLQASGGEAEFSKVPDHSSGKPVSGELTVQDAGFARIPLKQALTELEIRLVTQALESCRYNQRKAAEKLGLTYDQFRGIKRKHSIT